MNSPPRSVVGRGDRSPGPPAGERRRLLDAAAELVCERGYGRVTVADIVAAAGVSRGAFEAGFADKRDCVLAAHRAAFGRLMAEITLACEKESRWPRRLRAAVAALLALAAAEPVRVRLLVLGALRVDGDVGPRARECDAHLAALLRQGRRGAPGADPPALAEEVLIGGVAALLDDCLRAPDPARLAGLEPELTQLLLIPYGATVDA